MTQLPDSVRIWSEKTGYSPEDLSPHMLEFAEARHYLELLTNDTLCLPVVAPRADVMLYFWKEQFKRLRFIDPLATRFCSQQINRLRGRNV